MILFRLFFALLFVIVSSRLGSGCSHVSGSTGCVQPTMLVLFELCCVIVNPSPFIGMFVAGSHDVMDCVPVETSVDDTSVGLARSEPYGLSECVPSDTIEEENADSFCDSVAVGSVIRWYIAMLYHLWWCWWWWCVFVLCLVF